VKSGKASLTSRYILEKVFFDLFFLHDLLIAVTLGILAMVMMMMMMMMMVIGYM
jgi:hypothetical protein